MNIPLEARSDQSDLVREPIDAFADASRRDLNESDADVGPAAVPNASVVADEHEGGWRDDPSGDDNRHGETASGDEIDAEVPRECETGTAVAALDEVSKANLRRLETTLSQLHNEFDFCRLPRAAQLPPVSALPIDRISPVRTQPRPPSGPIWLQKQPTRPPPPPLPERGVFWPRAAKFLIPCGIAALLSYYLVVATSPLQKHLVGVTELAPVIQEPPAKRAHQPQDGMRASVAGSDSAPTETRAFGPEQLVEKLEFPASLPAGTANRSSAEMPAADWASVSVTKTANLQDVKLLIDRGRQFFEVGDLMAARIVFLRAVIAGESEAAAAMGATYDPVVLGDRGGDADLDKARSWYERAKEMGSPEGPRRLEMLANR
jgi:hypothetical protein